MKKIIFLLIVSTLLFPVFTHASDDTANISIVTIDLEESVEHRLLRLGAKLQDYRLINSPNFEALSVKRDELSLLFRELGREIEKSDPIDNSYVKSQAKYFNDLVVEGLNSHATVFVLKKSDNSSPEKIRVPLFSASNAVNLIIRYDNAPSDLYWKIVMIGMIHNGCNFEPDTSPVLLTYQETLTLVSVIENTPYFSKKDSSLEMMIDGIRIKRERELAISATF